MRIDSGAIGMESERTYKSTECRVRSYSVRVDANDAAATGAFSNMLSVSTKTYNAGELSLADQIQKIKEEYINLLLRLLFPDKEYDLRKDGIRYGGEGDSSNQNSASLMEVGVKDEYYYSESEEVSFKAQGLVKCKDGREISFNLNLEMSREFTAYYSEEINFLESALTDPLVINFDGGITDLSDQTIRFDIDSDGVEDEINNLVMGCGFLALDLNEDGIINDGSELFGTKSGDGFADLSKYDTDGDGFIDEDDEIFDSLKIMTIDEDGVRHLYSLKEKNVGAIGLMNNKTQYSINNLSDNSVKGVIRSTGIFLGENGGTGTIHQLDLNKRKAAVAAYA